MLPNNEFKLLSRNKISVLSVDISLKYWILASIKMKLETESRLGKQSVEYWKNRRYIIEISKNVDISAKY